MYKVRSRRQRSLLYSVHTGTVIYARLYLPDSLNRHLMDSRHNPAVPCTPQTYIKLRSCLTFTASARVDLFDILSQIGSTSGPSKSPAPSHPQHHTVKPDRQPLEEFSRRLDKTHRSQDRAES